MKTHSKLLLGLGAAATVQIGAAQLPILSSALPAFVASAWAESGEAGEEKGLAKDAVAFRRQLGLVRGHLAVGLMLYRAGHRAHAKTHMKHPGDELYAALKPAIVARGGKPFDAELAALATSVEGEQPIAEVEKAYKALLAAIARVETTAALDASQTLLTAAALVRVAAEEYKIGVGPDGALKNAHEYQDALGFVRTAASLVATIDTKGKAALAKSVADVRASLDGLKGAWPSVVPPKKVDFDGSALFVAAAKIEIAGLKAR